MPYLIFDLEMSGPEVGYHDIIQIGAVLADDQWNKISEFESLAYPENPDTLTDAAEEIHGISLIDLEEAPALFEVLENFENWIKKTLKLQSNDPLHGIVLCGQSVVNDINFLKFSYEELNMPWSFSHKMYDLMTMTFMMYQIFDNHKMSHPKSMSLKSVAEYFHLNRENEQHNALEDARLTFECMKEYMKLMKNLQFKANL